MLRYLADVYWLFPEASVNLYQTTRRHMPRRTTFHSHRHNNLTCTTSGSIFQFLNEILFLLRMNLFSLSRTASGLEHIHFSLFAGLMRSRNPAGLNFRLNFIFTKPVLQVFVMHTRYVLHNIFLKYIHFDKASYPIENLCSKKHMLFANTRRLVRRGSRKLSDNGTVASWLILRELYIFC
jgi:hypothetical protein